MTVGIYGRSGKIHLEKENPRKDITNHVVKKVGNGRFAVRLSDPYTGITQKTRAETILTLGHRGTLTPEVLHLFISIHNSCGRVIERAQRGTIINKIAITGQRMASHNPSLQASDAPSPDEGQWFITHRRWEVFRHCR